MYSEYIRLYFLSHVVSMISTSDLPIILLEIDILFYSFVKHKSKKQLTVLENL